MIQVVKQLVPFVCKDNQLGLQNNSTNETAQVGFAALDNAWYCTKTVQQVIGWLETLKTALLSQFTLFKFAEIAVYIDNILDHFDKSVVESNFPYGMTSNRGNQQDAISTDFLQSCYLAGNLTLAKKVEASLKKDLQQQMRYYKMLGDETNDDQLATNAYMILQGKGGTLSDRQMNFAQDIFTTYRMLMQIDQMDKQFNTKIPADTNKLK